MKRIKILVIMLIMLVPKGVFGNTIERIDIEVDLLKNGNANIKEKWVVDGSDGTEWYKVLNNMGNMELSNFKVYMDDNELIYKEWDIDETLNEKKGYYGINYTDNGLELCFGKYDYKEHVFVLSYSLSNFVFNTDDSQVIYYNFIDRLSNVNFKDFSIRLNTYYNIPDNIDVWGYGYKGYAYVSNGRIEMSNEDKMGDNYAVMLAKFPLGTFDINNRYSQFSTFNDVYERAEDGSFDYDENRLIDYIILILLVLIFGFIIGIIIYLVKTSGYGYIGNKKIDKKNTNMFRDIPCNKDIYYANSLIKLNSFGYKESNIFGAIILKWVREDKIKFIKDDNNNKKNKIDLRFDKEFDNDLEKKLFDMMKKASGDGILETKELEKWCRNNYDKFLDLFKKIENTYISKLRSEGLIRDRIDKNECSKKNVMVDKLYDDSSKLYGLKLYLDEFSNMNTKEVMEVKLWDEYLMFAYLFGIADKVAKQLKNLYPEVIEQSNIDYSTIMYVNHLSTRSVSAASSARAAAESYSAGGGGFSSGGGGGGSFGGGGGGSR